MPFVYSYVLQIKKRSRPEIDRLLVSDENRTLCTLIGSSFRNAGQLFFSGCLVLFFIVLKRCFLKLTDHYESDAYAVIVHIDFFLNNEHCNKTTFFFCFCLNILFFFPNIYKTGHLLIIFRQIC